MNRSSKPAFHVVSAAEIRKAPEYDRDQAAWNGLIVLRSLDKPLEVTDSPADAPPVMPFRAESLIQEELQRQRSVGEIPSLVSLCLGMEKACDQWQEGLARQQPDIPKLVDNLENYLTSTDLTTNRYAASQLEHAIMERCDAKRQIGDEHADSGPPRVSPEQLHDLDEQLAAALVDRNASPFAWLLASLASFLVMFILIVTIWPSQPLLGFGLAMVLSPVVGKLFAVKDRKSFAEQFVFAETLTREAREDLVASFDRRAARLLTIREGHIAEQVILEWGVREYATVLRESDPRRHCGFLQERVVASGPHYFVECDPGETWLSGPDLFKLVFQKRVRDEATYSAQVLARFAAENRKRPSRLSSAEALDLLQEAALAEFGASPTLAEILEAMAAHPAARSVLVGRLDMSAAAAQDIFKAAPTAAFDSGRQTGVLCVGFPSRPISPVLDGLMREGIPPTAVACDSSHPDVLEFVYSALNVPASHSREHQLGAQAFDELARKERETMWRVPLRALQNADAAHVAA